MRQPMSLDQYIENVGPFDHERVVGLPAGDTWKFLVRAVVALPEGDYVPTLIVENCCVGGILGVEDTSGSLSVLPAWTADRLRSRW
ncbi:hypothetical protein [Gordonia sputi]|uniref:hypothetical protein n=1 Tax=Gordonia sputi TaxID=36823 RepID=UPI0002F7949D|nr:hypothetical protein [Gordonia sputi]NKY94618.1 hypothetical protein [Gordonia sputi]